MKEINMNVFDITNLTYFYPQKNEPALKEINLCIKQGEFLLVLGKSGSGKSTLGKILSGSIPEFYGGRICGDINTNGEFAGMVFQDPERQLVMNGVEREVAFGLENLGVHYDVMRHKVYDTMQLLNLWHLKDKRTYEISGGEKQKVVVCSIVAMGYNFLVLDEPTSQLDAKASRQVFSIIKKLNKKMGYTVVLIEHKAYRWLELADRVLFMDNGRIIFNGMPQEFILWEKSQNINYLSNKSSLSKQLIPKNAKTNYRKTANMLIKYCEIKKNKPQKIYLLGTLAVKNKSFRLNTNHGYVNKEAVKMQCVNYTYDDGTEALKQISLTLHQSEVIGVIGQNGCGKSTLLKVIAKVITPQKGDILVKGNVGYLSQEPGDYLFNNTLYEELKYTLDNMNISDYSIIDSVLEQLELSEYTNINPRDLSSGERQRAAIASVMVMMPDILILDEPTRGLDKQLENRMKDIIVRQKSRGKTVIIATHDIELASSVCDRILSLSKGSIIKEYICKEK